MAQRRSSQLTIGYSPEWIKQADWDDPVSAAEMVKAFPATSRNYINVDETIEDITDCTGEDFLFELVTARIARLTVDMDFDPDVFAGIVAGVYGVAGTPSAGTDEVQTETITATGGTRTLTVQVGADAQTTTPLAFDADAATIQAALEALSNVSSGDIVVTGTGPFVYTFGGNLADQDVNLIVVNTYGLTGGTSTMAVTTPGVGSEHAISRTSGYSLPLFTFYIGFRGSSEQPVIFKNVVIDSIRVRSANRERVTATVQFIGSAELNFAVGYTMPACHDIVPLRFGDCEMSIGGVDYIGEALAREFEYYYENNVVPQYDGAGIDATRLERNDQRPSGMSMYILGEPGDSLFDLAKARTTLEAYIQCGPDSRMVKFIAPQGLIKLQPEAIRFGGDPPESELAIDVRPKKVSGDSDTPTNVVAVTNLGTAYILAES